MRNDFGLGPGRGPGGGCWWGWVCQALGVVWTGGLAGREESRVTPVLGSGPLAGIDVSIPLSAHLGGFWVRGPGTVLGSVMRTFSPELSHSKAPVLLWGSNVFLFSRLSLAASSSWPVASLGSRSLLCAEGSGRKRRSVGWSLPGPEFLCGHSQAGGPIPEVSFLTPQSRAIARIKSSLSLSTGTIVIQYHPLGLHSGFSLKLRGIQPHRCAHRAAPSRFADGDAGGQRDGWMWAKSVCAEVGLRRQAALGVGAVAGVERQAGQGAGSGSTDLPSTLCDLSWGLTHGNPAALSEGALVLSFWGALLWGLGET